MVDQIVIKIFISFLKEAKEPIFEWLDEQAKQTDTIIDDFVVDKLEDFIDSL
jgi:hypothetical protein